MKSSIDLIVIGGGAAGLMASGTAAARGLSVTLIERNTRTGLKLGITGKGRCNLTNDATVKEVVANVPTNGRFLYGALTRFGPKETMEFFEGLGVPLKTERGGRVFPVSDRALDVVGALRDHCKRSGVKVVTDRARELIIEDGRAVGVFTEKGEYRAKSVLLSTGGASYPATGSTGDGYMMARAAGHTINGPRASLVPLETVDEDVFELQGFAPRNVRLKLFEGEKLIFEDFGELLFTHFGVSGPLVLSASAHMRDDTAKYRISIDLKPALDEKKLDERILRDFAKYANRDFANALDDLAGRAMIPVLVRRSGIDPAKKVNSVTKEERRRLVGLFKDFSVEVKCKRPIAEAIVTSGGVATSEVDPRTMESKLVGGLYFAGEILDVDAYTGGFNLQIAWSTARAAAMSVKGGERDE